MDNLVSINHTKENILKFNLTIEGISPSDITAKFVIHAEGMELGFKAGRTNGDEWTVEMPAMPFLERTAYPFHFDVMADGYHFEPLRGTVNVVGGNDIYISVPKNAKVPAEAGPKEEKKPEPKKESIAVPSPADLPKKGKERSIAQIAHDLMESTKAKEPVPELAKEIIPEPVKIEPIVEAKVEEKTEEKKPTVSATLLPKITIEPKKGGEKDDAVRAVLEEAGVRKAIKKPRRFSLKNKD